MAASALTKRWHPVNLDPRQLAYHQSRARLNLVAAGRRAYKTEGAKRRVVTGAMSWMGRDNIYDDGTEGQFFACAPTHQQAKDIFWRDLKRMVPRWAMLGQSPRNAISESELSIRLAIGSVIRVAGLDKPARIEGGFWDGGVITEFGNTKPGLMDEHIHPMLIAGGWIDIEGVPEGRNHYYDLAQTVRACEDPLEMQFHHWTTEDVLWRYLGRSRAAKEIALAKSRMDPLVFDQEFRASFVNFTGRTYYPFDQERHAKTRLTWNKNAPLALCFDFNWDPGTCVAVQEGLLPETANPGKNKSRGTLCIGEVYARRANTKIVCDRVIHNWGSHKGLIELHGDASGGAQGSAQTEGSDWDLVEKTLRRKFGDRMQKRYPKANPAVRARVNAVNSRLLGASGMARMAVCPKGCPHLVKDLEGVRTIKGGSGEIDKKVDSDLTHVSDAMGYYVVREHPVRGATDFDTTAY